MNWRDATLDAISLLTLQSHRNVFSRQDLLDNCLEKIVAKVSSKGGTPSQTLSRVLQELRDSGFIEFLGNGEYRLISSSWVPLCADISNEQNIPSRVSSTISRILRDKLIVADLKRKYSYRCQLCNTRLEMPSGFYCEAHHIRPLGAPHEGPDTQSNLIIVCPNHHVLLDYGAIPLTSDSFQEMHHEIDDTHLDYHNSNIYSSPSLAIIRS